MSQFRLSATSTWTGELVQTVCSFNLDWWVSSDCLLLQPGLVSQIRLSATSTWTGESVQTVCYFNLDWWVNWDCLLLQPGLVSQSDCLLLQPGLVSQFRLSATSTWTGESIETVPCHLGVFCCRRDLLLNCVFVRVSQVVLGLFKAITVKKIPLEKLPVQEIAPPALTDSWMTPHKLYSLILQD